MTQTNAHVELFIGRAEEDERYDSSGSQTIAERVKSLILVMVREKLTPPPGETYSLHRRLRRAANSIRFEWSVFVV